MAELGFSFIAKKKAATVVAHGGNRSDRIPLSACFRTGNKLKELL